MDAAQKQPSLKTTTIVEEELIRQRFIEERERMSMQAETKDPGPDEIANKIAVTKPLPNVIADVIPAWEAEGGRRKPDEVKLPPEFTASLQLAPAESTVLKLEEGAVVYDDILLADESLADENEEEEPSGETPDVVVDEVDGLSMQTYPELHTNGAGELTDEMKPLSKLSQQLAEYLRPLEPASAEAVKTILDDIVQTTRKIYELQKTNTETTEVIEQELEKLCIELLEYLDIQYDDALVKKLTVSFINSIYEDNLVKANFVLDQIFLEEGTHEQKTGLTSLINMLQLVKKEASLLVMLGRLALRIRYTTIRKTPLREPF